MNFQPYDPESRTEKSRQNLSHWRQSGGTYFLTSRLSDSMPQPLLKRWKEDRQNWLTQNGVDSVEQLTELSEKLQHDFQRQFTARGHAWLDSGYGECHLKRRELAELFIAELVKGHRELYELDAWVIMPNHFHILVTPTEATPLSRIMQRWKGASARYINQRLGRNGSL